MGCRVSIKGRSRAFIVCAFVPFALKAQSGATTDQVQAVVHGLRSPQQALHVDQIIHGMNGVLLSRTDATSENLFILVRADVALDPTELRALLAPMGIRIACWTRRPRSEAPYQPLDPKACEPGITPK